MVRTERCTNYALVIVAAIGDAVYWSCYHAYFAALGDLQHRGHQISMREAIATLVGIASPLATGWMLVRFGPMAAFGAAAATTVTAALPLSWTPDAVWRRRRKAHIAPRASASPCS